MLTWPTVVADMPPSTYVSLATRIIANGVSDPRRPAAADAAADDAVDEAADDTESHGEAAEAEAPEPAATEEDKESLQVVDRSLMRMTPQELTEFIVEGVTRKVTHSKLREQIQSILEVSLKSNRKMN